MDLESGSPSGINYYADLYTWDGWLEAFIFFVVWHSYVYIGSGISSVFVFGIIYAFYTDIPLCKDEDFTDDFFNSLGGYSFNLCAYDWMKA